MEVTITYTYLRPREEDAPPPTGSIPEKQAKALHFTGELMCK